MNRGGRPKHVFWEAGGFELRKVEGKSGAYCIHTVQKIVAKYCRKTTKSS